MPETSQTIAFITALPTCWRSEVEGVHGDIEARKITWMGRAEDYGRAFTHGAIEAAIANTDAQLASIYDALYDRLIQFGAHPNEKSVSSSLKLDITAGETRLLQIYLQGDAHQLDHWIHTANQVGILVLKIFEQIHPQRFATIDAAKRISELSVGL